MSLCDDPRFQTYVLQEAASAVAAGALVAGEVPTSPSAHGQRALRAAHRRLLLALVVPAATPGREENEGERDDDPAAIHVRGGERAGYRGYPRGGPMWRRPRVLLVSLALLGAVALAPAAATAEPAAQRISVKLIDYRVRASARNVPAGRVTLFVHNADNAPHNLVVLRTRIAARALPVTGAHGRARELGRQGATSVLQDEQTVRLTLTLRAGRYLLICNVPGHYQRGMVVVFRVRG
jgi:uncharacterized cupredoxin-like copper-binding protein